MKNTLIIVVILIALAAAGYFLLSGSMGATPNEALEETPSQDSGSSAKINIDAVCEGALAYMTFTDGASADVFVEECKRGEHPEVIEQYKAQMGLGDGAAI